MAEVDFVEEKLIKERLDLVVEESWSRVIGLGIHHLKFYKKRRVLVGFSLKRRGFGLS